MKKIIKIFLVIIILFIIFLFVYLTPKDYDLDYQLNGTKVIEKYHKDDKYYEITLEYKDKDYKYISFNKYNKSRKIIDNIDIFEKEDYTCLIPQSNVIESYPLCKKENDNMDYHLIEGLEKEISTGYYPKIKTIKQKYKNIEINYLDDKTYLIWNYNGIDIINKENSKTVNIFEKDIYDISLAFIWNKNLVIPDYENDYYFKKFYIYDLEKERLTNWKLKNSIYFDSYILGFYDNSVFVFDRKQKKEYEIVPHKKKIRSISPRILNKNEWKKVSSNKLNSQLIYFEYDEIISYEIKNNKLYKLIDDYEILLSNQKVKDIIYYNNNEVYYLVDDILYKYTLEQGEVKLISNFEWNFNYENMIFVY